jgi:hypothetical protein
MATPFDISAFLPPRLQDKTDVSLLRNLVNRHLTKQSTVPLIGYIGDQASLTPGEIQINEPDLQRQMQQLSPILYGTHGTENFMMTWTDLIQTMLLLGVDYSTIGNFMNTKSYNFAPPIDLDKFCNFNEYYWVGPWVQSAPGLPYNSLGLAPGAVTIASMNRCNENFVADYYVIQRGPLDSNGEPVLSYPPLTTWTDWQLGNLWCHRDDLLTFLGTYSGEVSINDLRPAKRPIIEYSQYVRMNLYQAGGNPSASGTYTPQVKRSSNQPPLFDLYKRNGEHSGYVSSIFYYQELGTAPVDPVIDRRAVTDANGNFIFEQALKNPDTQELYFYTLYVPATVTNAPTPAPTPAPTSTITYTDVQVNSSTVTQLYYFDQGTVNFTAQTLPIVFDLTAPPMVGSYDKVFPLSPNGNTMEMTVTVTGAIGACTLSFTDVTGEYSMSINSHTSNETWEVTITNNFTDPTTLDATVYFTVTDSLSSTAVFTFIINDIYT